MSDQLRDEVRHIRRAVDGRVFAGKLAILCVLIASGVVLVSHAAAWSVTAGVVLLGLMYAHAVELQHEALHGIGFRSPRANVVAGVLLGLPMLTSFAAYRAAHMRHHRDLGTPDNQEFFDYGDQYGDENRSTAGKVLGWIYRMSMIGHYRQFVIAVATMYGRSAFADEKPATIRNIRRDYLIMALLVAGGLVWTVVSGDLLVVWLWFLPLLLVAGPVHALVELPEHFRCDTDTTDVFRNTRTIRSNRLMAWFTNGNNFHVEHHFMPSLPIAQLGELHAALDGKVVYHNFHPTYVDFLRSLAKPAPRDVTARDQPVQG